MPRMMTRHPFGPAAVAVLVLAAAAAAQLPSGTRYVASSPGASAGNAIVGFDAAGVVTTIVPLQNATTPASIAMASDNEQVLVWDHNLLHAYHIVSGAQNPRTLVAPGLSGGLLHEDGGMTWACSQGLLLKSDDQACTKLYTVTSIPTDVFGCVGWNGSTGEWVVAARDSAATTWKLLYIDSIGWVSRTLTGLAEPTGIDWSPWSGDLYVADAAGGVIRIDGQGGITTIRLPAVPARAELQGLEMREQPVEELVLVEGGAAPQHLAIATPGGGLVALHTSSGTFAPSDVALVQERQIWALNQWALGKLGTLHVGFGPAQAGKFYQVALSFGHTPGIALGPLGTVHLNPDGLLLTSLLVGAPVFNSFCGVLDSRGRAASNPTVLVPNDFALYGLRIFGGAIAFDQSGITALSNCWATTLTYT
ncbi:MAG: hypothetical protein JXQ29_06420 [Planctomycetes bacterium]|nr:hypothetical protein [Planctomycetota bacterium]